MSGDETARSIRSRLLSAGIKKIMPSVICDNVVKTFGRGGKVRALDGLTFEVGEGEVFGLLGPNGSGKTTFVKCCLNIIFPTSGRIQVLGKKPGHPSIARQTGYLPENPNFYDHLSGREFLHYHAELAEVLLKERKSRVEDSLQYVKLDMSAAGRRLRTYSKGMLQRIGIAQALINRPTLVFLDEPQTGLDPIGRRQIKDIMKEIAGNGSAVFFSSHVLSDVEDVADRVAIIDHGRLRKIATVDELTRTGNKVTIRLGSNLNASDGIAPNEAISKIAQQIGAEELSLKQNTLICSVQSEDLIPELISSLCGQGFRIFEVKHERLSLEDSFLKEFGALVEKNEKNDKPLDS